MTDRQLVPPAAASEPNSADYLGSDQRDVLLKAEGELLGWKQQPGCTLALSGGGIRSAAFGLGVLHALMAQQAAHREHADSKSPAGDAVFDCFDYQSTVSGGGFLGATLLWLRYLGHTGKLGKVSAMRMLGRVDSGARVEKAGSGAAPVLTEAGDKESPASPDPMERAGSDAPQELNDAKDKSSAASNSTGDDRDRYDWLDFIRLHGNYLKPPSISKSALFAVVLRNMVIAGGTYFALLLCAMFALVHGGVINGSGGSLASAFPWLVGAFGGLLAGISLSTYFASVTRGPRIALALLLLASLLLLLWFSWSAALDMHLKAIIVAALFTVLALTVMGAIRTLIAKSHASLHYHWRFMLLQASGYLLSLFIGALVLMSLPWVTSWLEQLGLQPAPAGSVGALLGALGAVFQFVRGPERRQQQPSRLRSIGLKLLVAIFVYSLLLLAYYGVKEERWLTADAVWPMLAGALAISLLMNSDYLSIGRVYRDRLAEAFMPDLDSFSPKQGGPQWHPATGADQLGLQAFAKDKGLAKPYPLINCHVVLSASGSSLFHGRGGDSFVMSPLYSGSDATGWIKTATWTGGDPLSVATATAISGAAFSPRTSDGSIAWLKDNLVSLLLSFFHLRLGTWLVNPRRHRCGPEPSWLSTLPVLKPNLLIPGLQQGLLGAGLHEKAPWIDVTDGGHFENLGIYELIRRKARYIVSLAGSCDAGYHQLDLANALQRCRTDFGAHFYWRQNYEPRHIVPARDEEPLLDCFERSHAFAKRAFALAEISYADGTEGLLLYVQSTIIADLPPEVESYKREFAAFPNQSTLDQFFDERQFEAYRELGYCLGVKMFEDLDQVVNEESTTGDQITEALVGAAETADASPNRWARPSVNELRKLLRIGAFAQRRA